MKERVIFDKIQAFKCCPCKSFKKKYDSVGKKTVV